MKIAIPMNNDHVAGHFTKAHSLLLCDEQGQELARMANPALDANCSGKQSLLDLLASHQVERVVVRNIGERMLGKLLEQGFQVHHLSSGRGALNQLVEEAVQRPNLLSQASQGQPSVNYQKKQAEGGCGCGHEHGAEEHSCHQHQAQGGGRCCEQSSAPVGVRHAGHGQRKGCCRS